MTMKTRFAQWMLLAGSLALAGCSVVPEPQADRTRFYVLSASQVAETAVFAQDGFTLGLKKITLPSYLAKGSIVIRQGAHELTYNDYARWAEPLEDGVARLVRNSLLASPRVNRVFTEGFPFDQERDYDVAIMIHRGEGVRQNDWTVARFAATVEITSPKADGKVVTRRMFGPVEVAWDGRDYGALVQAISDAVTAMGDEIVSMLPAR